MSLSSCRGRVASCLLPFYQPRDVGDRTLPRPPPLALDKFHPLIDRELYLTSLIGYELREWAPINRSINSVEIVARCNAMIAIASRVRSTKLKARLVDKAASCWHAQRFQSDPAKLSIILLDIERYLAGTIRYHWTKLKPLPGCNLNPNFVIREKRLKPITRHQWKIIEMIDEYRIQNPAHPNHYLDPDARKKHFESAKLPWTVPPNWWKMPDHCMVVLSDRQDARERALLGIKSKAQIRLNPYATRYTKEKIYSAPITRNHPNLAQSQSQHNRSTNQPITHVADGPSIESLLSDLRIAKAKQAADD